MQSKRVLGAYIIVNLVGVFLYLGSLFAIYNDAKREEREYDFGDSLNFMVTGLPILGVAVLFNLAWLVKALIDAFRRRGFLPIIATVIAIAIWVTSIQIFRYSH